MQETEEMVRALQIRIESLQIINDALITKIEALELLNENLRYLRDVRDTTGVAAVNYTLQNAQSDEDSDEDNNEGGGGKKRGRKPKPDAGQIGLMQRPLDAELHEILAGERFNRATYRALSGILLCLFENKTATVSILHEYIGGARVTVVRHTALLKKLDLISYVGSRKKGHYALTDRGRELYHRVRDAAGI